MTKFYWLGDNNGDWAVADAADDHDDYSLWDLIDSLRSESEWSPLRLHFGDGALGDLPPSSVLGRLCSARLVEVLKPFGGNVLWLPVEITRGDEVHAYSFMHFCDVPDILDEHKSTFVNGEVINAHISAEKAGAMPLLCLRKLSPMAIVRNDVRKELQKHDFSGIGFSRIPSS